MRTCIERRASRGQWAWAGLLALVLPLTACDFEVTNPGPVQDKFLDGPLAYDGIVAGAQRALLDAHYDNDLNNASGAREIFPGGNVGRHGVNNSERQGVFDMTVTATYWNTGQNARWLAEQAVSRFQTAMGAAYNSSKHAGLANLYAGYANRHMGELFCEAVIDGGPLLPYSEYFVRAERYFTDAMAILTAANQPTSATAAQAGRASVRLDLGKFAEAAADAGPIANSFKYVLDFFNLEETQWNFWVAATASEPFRTITTWNTFYESYFKTTGDPRTPWDLHPTQKFGSALVAPWGSIPFYRQKKYLTRDDDQNLSSGPEMRLIQAEALLQAGDWQQAMTLINTLRTTYRAITIAGITDPSVVAGTALQPWTANNLVEAGTAFKKEHGIQLWLEGRRFGARHRWDVQQLPGDLTIWEVPSTTAPVHDLGTSACGPTCAGTLLSPSSTVCMEVPRSERQLNPNIGYP